MKIERKEEYVSPECLELDIDVCEIVCQSDPENGGIESIDYENWE